MAGMTVAELGELTAIETAALVRGGELTVTAIVEAALKRIAADEHNGFERVLTSQARAQAAELDDSDLSELPLAGVPVAVKSENDIAGLITTFGGRGGTRPARADSEVVRRLRQAGAVIVATTTMPEFGQFPVTESSRFGTTTNPHDPTRSPGGSSGGSAVAVATACVPVAIAGDGGGSIRIPASACGLVGLKPMRGRVQTAPNPNLWGELGTIGPLTKTVADTALVYDAIAATSFSQPLLQAASQEPGRLRIGWLSSPAAGNGRVDPEVAQATGMMIDRLAALGHELVPAGRWPRTETSFIPQFLAAIRDEVAMVDEPGRVERRSAQTARLGRLITNRTRSRAITTGNRLAERFADFDVVLSPTLAQLPPLVGMLDGVGSFTALWRSVSMVAFTTLANVTGCPAMSIPGGRSRSGLPIGLQLSTFKHDEAVLVKLAATITA